MPIETHHNLMRNAGYLREKWRIFARVVFAVLLRELQTRIGRGYFSFVISIAWPLSHIVVLLLGFTLFNRITAIGANPSVFAATGLVPYILCLYQSRVIAQAININIPLLSIPIIKPIHLIVARVISETISSIVVLALLALMLFVSDIDIYPYDPPQAILALLATVYLGVCFGFAHTIITMMAGMAGYIGFIFFIVGLYVTAGVFIPLSIVPEHYLYWMSYNPLFACVQWLRSSYFGIDEIFLDRFYVFEFGTVMLWFGLAFERIIRGRLMTM